MKLNFPSNSKCYSYIFCPPKTQNDRNETQLPFELKVLFIHVLHPKTEDVGYNSTSLRVPCRWAESVSVSVSVSLMYLLVSAQTESKLVPP
jgi:hypothetical protein